MIINIAITRTICPECVEKFEAALRAFVQQTLKRLAKSACASSGRRPGLTRWSIESTGSSGPRRRVTIFDTTGLFRTWEKYVAAYTVGDR